MSDDRLVNNIFPNFVVNSALLCKSYPRVFAIYLAPGFYYIVVKCIWYLFTGRTRIKVSFRNFRIDLTMIWRIVRIGIPALVSGLQRGATQMIIMWFVVPFGTAAVAAHSLNQRIEIMMLMPTFALGMASGVLAGQNLGAGQPDRAAKSSWISVALVEGIMFVFCMVIIFAAEHIVHIFSTEPDVVQISATYLRIGILLKN